MSEATLSVVSLPRRRWGTIARAATAAAERFAAKGYGDRSDELTGLAEKIETARSASDVTIQFDDAEHLALDELMVITGIGVSEPVQTELPDTDDDAEG